jgi:hypothetical protein
VIRRDERDNNTAQGDPHRVFYLYDGKELGTLDTDGTFKTDYATSVADRTAQQGTGPFRNGAASGSFVADFNAGYDPITTYNQGSNGGSYRVREGDTLQSIAQSLFGDAGLWYTIAQANGITGDFQLREGQILTLPRGVVRTTNNAGTYRAYNPASVVGDVQPDTPSPTTPQPQSQSRGKKNKCGIFGAIILAVVAVAVTALAGPAIVGFATKTLGLGALGGAIVGGALTGAAGSIASQAVGVATGIQDGFSFKGVALAALAGGIGGGLGQVKALGGAGAGATNSATSASFLQNAARGAIGNALTQGAAVIVGLQSRFNFAAVAAGAAVRAAGGRSETGASSPGLPLELLAPSRERRPEASSMGAALVTTSSQPCLMSLATP